MEEYTDASSLGVCLTEVNEPCYLWKGWTARQVFDEWQDVMQYCNQDKPEVKKTLLRLELKLFQLNAIHQAGETDTGREPEGDTDFDSAFGKEGGGDVRSSE